MFSTWSTETVAPSDRFAYWQDAVCQAVLNVSTESPPQDQFRARISSRAYGAVRIAAFNANSHNIVRRPSHVRALTEGGYLVSLQQRGSGLIEQGGERFVLTPGEIAILDGEQPFKVCFPETVHRLVSVIPRVMLESRAPWLQSSPARKISGESVILDLARQHLAQLSQATDLAQGTGALLAENVCNLLAVATAPDATYAQASCNSKLEFLLVVARQHLADPELSPERLAALCGISVRTLHLRFKHLGTSCGQWILNRRLEACRDTLADPRQQACAISDVAYRWGFNDLSHFNKAFRRRYAMTPRQWRRES